MPHKHTDNPFRSMRQSGRSRGPYGRGGYPPAGQAARAGAVAPGFAALAARGANARPSSASSQFAERAARRATEGPEVQARARERAASRTRGPGMNPFMSRMLLQQLGASAPAGPVTDPFPSQGDLSGSLPMDGPPSSGPLGPGPGPIDTPILTPPTDIGRSIPVPGMQNLPARASGAPPGMVEVSSTIAGEPIYDYPENAWRYEGVYS